MPDISLSEWARLLEVKPQAVTAQVDMGLPASKSLGKGKPRYVNSRAAIDWMVDRAVEKVKTPDDGETLVRANLRRARAEADSAEIKAAKDADQVIAIEAVESMLDRAMVLVSSQLDGMGGRLAATIAAETDPAVCRQIIFDECRRIREALARELEARAAMEASSAEHAPAAGQDAGPVGGPVPDPAAG